MQRPTPPFVVPAHPNTHKKDILGWMWCRALPSSSESEPRRLYLGEVPRKLPDIEPLRFLGSSLLPSTDDSALSTLDGCRPLSAIVSSAADDMCNVPPPALMPDVPPRLDVQDDVCDFNVGSQF